MWAIIGGQFELPGVFCNIISAVSGLYLVIRIPSHQDVHEKFFHQRREPANHVYPGSQRSEGPRPSTPKENSLI